MRRLRRFGLAVARDNRLLVDEAQAQRAVEGLCNRALLAARNGEGPPAADLRVRLYALFIRLLRRHMRLAAGEEPAADSTAPRPPSNEADGQNATVRAVRRLPLELREALLLVALEGLSHVEAAQALDIPLAALIDRLVRARAALSIALAADREPFAFAPRRGRPNLRLVK